MPKGKLDLSAMCKSRYLNFARTLTNQTNQQLGIQAQPFREPTLPCQIAAVMATIDLPASD